MVPDLDYYQKLLEEEKNKLEADLGDIARPSSDSSRDWDVKPPIFNIESKDEAADQEEEMENRTSVELALESRLLDVKDAILRVQNGTFGMCEVGKEQIPEERLKANPAARTCIQHSTK